MRHRQPVSRILLTSSIVLSRFKDATGARENVFLGRGSGGIALPVLRFEGRIQIVKNEDECNQACAYLESRSIVGFDTENVAFIPPHSGVNRQGRHRPALRGRVDLLHLRRARVAALLRVLRSAHGK
jgi:hypothetical protein